MMSQNFINVPLPPLLCDKLAFKKMSAFDELQNVEY